MKLFVITRRYGTQLEEPEIHPTKEAAESSVTSAVYEFLLDNLIDELEEDGIDETDVDSVIKWAADNDYAVSNNSPGLIDTVTCDDDWFECKIDEVCYHDTEANYKAKEAITMDDLGSLVADLKHIKKTIVHMPRKEISIILEEGDKRKLSEIDLSLHLETLDEDINCLLDEIYEKAKEIYKNAVDEREGLPEDSLSKRALWLDDVNMTASCLMSRF